MGKLTIFKLKYCGFCRNALQYVDELVESTPEFKNIEIEMIDEGEQRELAKTFDYYYVPTFYIGSKKVHEGPVNREDVQNILRQACKTDSD